MSTSNYELQLPKAIDRYLSFISKLYGEPGKDSLLEIIVNSQVRIHEVTTYDNWDGGTYGHTIYFSLSESLYLKYVNTKEKLQNQIREDINKAHNIKNEFIEDVFLDLNFSEAIDWRKESGVLLSYKRSVNKVEKKRVWNDGGYRVFLSHKVSEKAKVAKLKEELKLFGISGFVAHEDIHPTKEWQNEIENAIFSMDAFVALMTKEFHNSDWTDQELGVAFGRSVPIVAVKLGRDPYGFIGKFQALSTTWKDSAKEIIIILIKNEGMKEAYLDAVQRCTDWDNGNTLSEMLPHIESLSENQVTRLIEAYNNNNEVRGSFGFNGSKPTYYGEGLIYHLRRITGREYQRTGKKIVNEAVP